METRLYEYVIDGNDVITHVNNEWRSFALGNTAPELPGQVLGSWLWQHLHGIEVKHLYRTLLDRVREKGTVCRIPFRCDAPHLRRFMMLEVTPLKDHEVRFISWVVREEPRASVSLFSPGEERQPTEHQYEDMVTMCAWCKRLQDDDGVWREIEEALEDPRFFSGPRGPGITHGACPECRRTIMAAIGIETEQGGVAGQDELPR